MVYANGQKIVKFVGLVEPKQKTKGVKTMIKKKQLIKALEDAGIEYKKFYFEGSWKTYIDNPNGFPYAFGKYRDGGGFWYERFVSGADRVEDGGNVWVKVYEDAMKGDAWVASWYYAIYVKEEDIEKYNEIVKKLEEENK